MPSGGSPEFFAKDEIDVEAGEIFRQAVKSLGQNPDEEPEIREKAQVFDNFWQEGLITVQIVSREGESVFEFDKRRMRILVANSLDNLPKVEVLSQLAGFLADLIDTEGHLRNLPKE